MERLNSQPGSISAYRDDKDSEYCSATDGLGSDDEELDGQHSSVTSDLESRSSREQDGIRKPSLNTSHLRFPRRGENLDNKPQDQRSDHPDSSANTANTNRRAWYEFDLAVIVALLSPFGKWLTGGDHVKHLLFIALVVYYLHQVIEVPWMLYQKTRHHRRPDHPAPVTLEDKHRELALTEIRKIELYTLTVAAISPFIGAYFLRYATRTVLGSDYISWFSTGLFVMATGIRPWSHLVERFSQRTADLKDFIHNTSPREAKETSAPLLQRIDDLEGSLAIVENLLKRMHEDTVDYVDKTVGGVKGSLQRNEKRWRRQDERLRSVEQSISALFESKKESWSMSPQTVFSQVFSGRSSSSQNSPETEEYSAKFLGSTADGNQPTEFLKAARPFWFRLVMSLVLGVGQIVFFPARTVIRVLFG
ncbi:hypothetical protein AGABI1DRAFT_115713 [Agaricus bisporus var. burnettii JB137-S8]|uniref:Uncharacterized protein n=1 Tax=Agaricus bisporus var. burnettii (strain JB137-S8 / ATCC MYA-4627 / FGSC 10392) TaxID=597362 RepID=K5XPJ5_AGABU|nr:uncharacterized protein AGABI1DRAFT_115713 [Agaricus bisporus var. burnettii JB137-S8]EKM76625.1 hypothetical protein AGABI1DRAFT_115713 [Agaricus bisporus var. burnettii JB137-S8]